MHRTTERSRVRVPLRAGLRPSAGLQALMTIVFAAGCLLFAAPNHDTLQAQSYRQRLTSIRSRQSQVQSRLKAIKGDQAEASSQLSAARNKAQQARDRATDAKQHLEEVRSILREVKTELVRTEEELAEERETASVRLLALYQNEQPSYLEVLLNATSFEDFTNRAEISRIIAEKDQEILTELVETEAKLSEQRETLEIAQIEAAQLKQQADAAKAEAEKAEREAQAILAKYQKDRRAAEADYASLEAAAKEMSSFVRSRASSSSGGGSAGSYSGSCAGNLLQPCGGRITSRFGWRIHPILRTRRFHDGVDIAAGAGTTIKASDDGRVIFAGWKGPYGRAVVIDHGSGWSTLYGHCSALYVSTGQTVSRGQRIAAVGSTGWSTGPHLHWTVYRNGRHVNPLG